MGSWNLTIATYSNDTVGLTRDGLIAIRDAGLSGRLSESARVLLQSQEPYISPMVCLQLQYLFEIGRIKHGSDPVVQGLAGQLGLRVCDRPVC
jgi:hypothetical protein